MKRVIRTQKISIDKPSIGDEAWIHCILQSVDLSADFKVLEVSSRVDQLNRKGHSVLNEKVNITNPFSGEKKELSGLDLQLGIAAFCQKWIMEEYSSKGMVVGIDGDDNVIVENAK